MKTRNNNKNYQDITRFKMIHDHVLVRGIKVESVGGIIKADSYEDKPELGQVISVGNGRVLWSGEIKELTIKPKDIVLFNKYSSEKFNLDGEDYYVVREEDITGYIRQ